MLKTWEKRYLQDVTEPSWPYVTLVGGTLYCHAGPFEKLGGKKLFVDLSEDPFLETADGRCRWTDQPAYYELT